MSRVFPEGYPDSYLEMARQWLKFKYGKDLEDFEVLEYLEDEIKNALVGVLEPLSPEYAYLTASRTWYLTMSDFYKKVKEEIQ